jgi:hypothetical protein
MTACLFPDLSGLSSGGSPDGGDAPYDGGGSDAAVPVPPTEVDLGLGYVEAFTVDATSIYFMSSSLGGFFSADKNNGGNRVQISTDSAYSIKVDANNYYWSTGAAVVQRGRGQGSNNITILSGTPVSCYAIASSTVYATTGGDPGGAILSAPIGGGSPSTLVSTPYPDQVAVDDRIYFTGGGGVLTAPLTGGNPSQLLTNAGNADLILVVGNGVYWRDEGSGTYPEFPSSRIQTIDKSGAPATQKDLTGPEYTIQSIAADTTNLYYSVNGPPSMDDAGNAIHPAGEIHRVPLAGGPITVLAKNQSAPNYIALDDAYVYWVDQDDGTVWRAPK